jgi:hypothetical protein
MTGRRLAERKSDLRSLGLFDRELEAVECLWHLANRRLGLSACPKDFGVLARTKDALVCGARWRNPHLQPRGARRLGDKARPVCFAHTFILGAVGRSGPAPTSCANRFWESSFCAGAGFGAVSD